MDPELLARAESIFHKVIVLPVDEQISFLDRECAGDDALRTLLIRMLVHDEDKKGFLTPPESNSNSSILSPVPTAGTWISNYQLVRLLGQGGMGQVFLARQEKPQRDVAIKLLRSDFSDESLSRRFQLEVEILGRLNHPGIAQIFEAGISDEGHSFFAMEYAPGLPLGEFLRKERIGSREKLELAIQVCEAVQHAHEHGIIHRDLKPSNIMAIRQAGGQIQTRILDFGVARVTNPDGVLVLMNTIPGQLVGTLDYMSPEQIAGSSEDLDVRSDIFQLGVIVYEMLAGKLPLDVGTSGFAESMRVINNEEPLLLGATDRAFRGDIETIINKAMAKDRAERYTSADELAADIRHHLAGETILARPTKFFYRPGKTLKRHRSLILNLAGFVLVAFLLVFFQTWKTPQVIPNSPRLTKLVGTEGGHFPGYSLSLSPNGKHLAYSIAGDVVFRNMESDDTFVRVPKIPEARWARGVSWFPSGKEILIECVTAGSGFQLVRFDLSSDAEQIILKYEGDARPMVSPDGKRVLLVRGSEHEFAVLDLKSGELSTVVQVDESESLACPAWSPDSRHIVFERIKEPSCFLECVDLSGQRSVLLEDKLLVPYPWFPAVAWLPDGRLLYTRMQDFHYSGTDLMVLPMNVEKGQVTGEPVLVHSMENRVMRDLTYSAASNTLVFSANLRQYNLVQFDLTNNPPFEARVLPMGSWRIDPIGWFPDGETLVLSEANSRQEAKVFTRDMGTGETQSILCCPKAARPLGLFPCGKYLVMLEETKVIAVPLDCGPIIDLEFEFQTAPRRIEVICPRGDSRHSYLLIRKGDELQMHGITLENGVEKECKIIPLDLKGIYAHRNAWGHLSPDGQTIAIIEFKPEVKLYDIKTGSTIILPTDLGIIQNLRWSWDGKWIYCQGLNGKEFPRWMGRIDPETGTSEVIWSSTRDKIELPYPSPDGKSLVSRRTTLGAELFILQGL